MNELARKKCLPCEGGVAPLTDAQVGPLLKGLSGWTREGKAIAKTYRFSNYHETMAFVNAVAFIAHTTDHHPDLSVHYNRCIVRFNTHDVQGISETDFECAAAVDALLK